MKFSTAVVPLLCATLASSRSLFGTPKQEMVNPAFKVPGDNPLEFCQSPSDYIGQVESVDLSPNPPTAGSTLKISATGHLTKTIKEGAKVQLRVKYNTYITLINTVADLCENLPKIGLQCPLEKGPMVIQQEANIPSRVPPGTYEVYANVITEDGEEVVCMETSVHF